MMNTEKKKVHKSMLCMDQFVCLNVVINIHGEESASSF